MENKKNPFTGRKIAYWLILVGLLFVGTVLLIAFLCVDPTTIKELTYQNLALLSGLSYVFACVFGATAWMWAYSFEIERRRRKKELYIKQQTKAIEEEYYSLDADIHHRASKKSARSFREGLSHEFCPKCGNEIEPSEIFCGICGTKLEKVCPNCKTTNNISDRFCRSCGKKL